MQGAEFASCIHSPASSPSLNSMRLVLFSIFYFFLLKPVNSWMLMKKQEEGRKNLNDDMEKKVMILGAILSTMPCYSCFFLLSKYYVS